MRSGARYGLVAGLALLVLMSAGMPASASLSSAQPIGVSGPIVDEFGQLLQGTNPAAADLGLTMVVGDLVQILHATDGQIYPPDANGNPDPRNVVLGTTRIGYGIAPTLPESGEFGTTISPRPGGNSKIFVRVFNAPSLENASFYGDSQLFTVKSWLAEVFMAEVAATDKALDEADEDGDGLNNSWETSYGSSSTESDSDGDGQSDGAEVMAGTDVMDSDSLVELLGARPVSGGVELKWESAEGRSYRVEYTNLISGGAGPSSQVAQVPGQGGIQTVVVPADAVSGLGYFRLCVVP